MSLQRLFSRVAALVAAASLFIASPLRAQDAPDSGWFDPNESSAAPAADATAPVQSEPERRSLPPSPLLREQRGSAPAEAEVSDTDPRALRDFRPRLDPYGTWVEDPTYGTVWVPSRAHVGSNFAPYVSSGRWALTDDGDWIWQSDYPFGPVVFHYGRWVWVSGTGWAWIPGYRYAPAWVSWRVPTGSYAYVGWAPLGPDYVWFNGVAVSVGWGVPTPWVFVPSSYVFYPHVHYYVVRDRAFLPRLAAHTRRYAPAYPRGYARGGARYAPAAPRVAGSSFQRSRGPSLASARVPAAAVPRERVRATPFAPSGRSAPATAGAMRRFDSRLAPAPRRADAPEQRYLAPAPRRAGPASSPGAAPRLAPRPAAPARFERPRPLRDAPAPRTLPAPRMPRSNMGPAPRLPRPRQ